LWSSSATGGKRPILRPTIYQGSVEPAAGKGRKIIGRSILNGDSARKVIINVLANIPAINIPAYY
jgi:hypothetical protein